MEIESFFRSFRECHSLGFFCFLSLVFYRRFVMASRWIFFLAPLVPGGRLFFRFGCPRVLFFFSSYQSPLRWEKLHVTLQFFFLIFSLSLIAVIAPETMRGSPVGIFLLPSFLFVV